MRLDFSVYRSRPEPQGDRLRRDVGYFAESRSIACLDLAPQGGTLAVRDGWHTDADNLFVVLTARRLNQNLRIIAKALDEATSDKLQQVGADGARSCSQASYWAKSLKLGMVGRSRAKR